MSMVVEGIPVEIDPKGIREYEDPENGAQRRLSFKLSHPETEGDRWKELCEVGNDRIARVLEAAKKGEVIRFVARLKSGKSKNNNFYTIVHVGRLLN